MLVTVPVELQLHKFYSKVKRLVLKSQSNSLLFCLKHRFWPVKICNCLHYLLKAKYR